MNICKSCGVTIHEEGKIFCPACEASAKDAKEVGLAGDGPEAEKVEVSLEDDTQRVSVVKLTEADKKAQGGVSQTEKTDAGIEKKEADPEEGETAPKDAPAAPAPGDDDRLTFSEAPLAEPFAPPEAHPNQAEPETLAAAIEKSGPKSYLSAEERKALLSELGSAHKPGRGAAVRETLSASKPDKPELKRGEAAMTVREPHPAAGARADRLSPTAVARGIAYYSGTHIHLVGGAHLASGEELVFKDRIYVLKEKPGTAGGGKWVYIVPMLLLLMAGAMLWMFSRPTPGGIAGLALDSRTRSTLPGAKVRILEKGISAVTNDAGFFVLPKVPAGSYTLQATGPGVEGNAVVQVSEGGIAPIIVTMQPTPEEILSQAPAAEPGPAAQNPPQTPARTEPVTAGLALSVDPADAEAYLDGQSMGSGGIFKDLSAGTHNLAVKRDGYQEWQNEVDLKPGRTNRVRVALIPKAVPSAASQPARKGFEDYLKDGQGYLAKNDYAKAAASFAEAVKIRPGSALASELLGEAYWGKQNVGSGNNAFMKAARLYAEQGSYPKAEGLYQKVLEADPNTAQAYLELGNAYLATGDADAARRSFQQHTKLFGGSPDGFFALGKLEYQERRFKEASKAFEKALANSAKPGLVYGYLTLTYIQIDNKKKAQAAYDSFMKLATPDELSLLKSHRDWSRVVADLSVPE